MLLAGAGALLLLLEALVDRIQEWSPGVGPLPKRSERDGAVNSLDGGDSVVRFLHGPAANPKRNPTRSQVGFPSFSWSLAARVRVYPKDSDAARFGPRGDWQYPRGPRKSPESFWGKRSPGPVLDPSAPRTADSLRSGRINRVVKRIGRGSGRMTLTSFASVDRSTLRWLRTGETPLEFTLSAGDSPVTQLRWINPGGSLATAETVSGAWTLKRGGFLSPHITVRQSGAGENLARLTVHLSHHAIELANGVTYRFHRAGVLVPAWKVTTDAGREILHIEPVRDGRKLVGGAALAAPAAVDLPDLLLLVVVGWYFIVLTWFEDEALETLTPFEGPDPPVRADGAR